MVGSALTEKLLHRGFKVAHVGRSARGGKVPCFRWSISENYLDPKALEGVDAIIHLAGAGVADGRWTSARKQEIMASRVDSGKLLCHALKTVPNAVKTVISASGIGFYGLTTEPNLCTEVDAPGTDFLATVCVAWEQAIKPIEAPDARLAIFRIGVVLSNKGGALAQMAAPVRWGVGAPLGTGKQMISWVHIDDLCNMMLAALEQPQWKGIYNAVAPNPISNGALTKAIGTALHRPVWPISVPGFALRLMVGQMAEIVLSGARVSCEKVKQAGFKFEYEEVGKAIRQLLSRKKD